MSPQRSLALLVAAAMMSLAVLAHASPPDPDWIGGFWDNGRDGEPVLFEMGSDGRVTRLKVGPNYSTPVR